MSTVNPAPGADSFFFGFAVPWEKLLVARVAIFVLLAIDALLQIAHAPRYGTGFNVTQLPGFAGIAPECVGYEVGQLLDAYLLALAAFGVAPRLTVSLAAAIYGWLYFGSQLDSYQHHDLVFMVLVVASFVPWTRPPGDAAAQPVRSWALRLILVELAIVYLWAAISKLDAAWIDGTTLDSQTQGGVRTLVESTVGWKAASVLVILTELGLAATIWWRRAWPIVAPVGMAFHIGIVATGLEIGLFAYLTLGFYLLVVPDAIYRAVAGNLPRSLLGRISDRPSWVALPIALVAGIAIAAAVRFQHALACGIAATVFIAALAAVGAVRRHAPRIGVAAGHVAALLVWLGIDRGTPTAIDYYRFWSSSQRRLGDKADAERAYRHLVEIAPDNGNGRVQLGRLLLELGRPDEALVQLHAAQRIEKNRAHSFLLEARHLARTGKTAEALTAAKAGLGAEPSNAEVRALLESLAKPGGPAPAPLGGDVEIDPPKTSGRP